MLLTRCQFHRQGCDDLLGNFVLQVKHVDHFAVIALGPEVSARCGVDELRVDSHTVIGPTNAALKHISYTEFLRNLPDLHRLPFVRKCRVAGDDEEAGDFGEIGDKVLGYPIAKIFLIRVSTHVDKGQHGNGGLIW